MTREADIEKACDRLAESYGYRVIRFSQRRASRISAGVPDRRYQGARGALWFEVKMDDGKLTNEQHTFLVAELKAGSLATCGGVRELGAVLSALVTAPRSALSLCEGQVALWAKKGYRREAA